MITSRTDLSIGMLVNVFTDDKKEVRGYISSIISKGQSKKGIQVKLSSGVIGRVSTIINKDDLKREQFKFLNEFLYLKEIYSIWDNQNQRYITINSNDQNIALLFSSKEAAYRFIDDKDLNSHFQKLTINKLNKKRLIAENFKTLNVSHFILDRKVKIMAEVLTDKEMAFINLLK